MMSLIEFPYDVNDPNLRSNFLRNTLPQAINSLEANTESLWGKMTAQHMVEHLIYSFQMSTDKLELECHTPKGKIDKLQRFLDINRPMPKGFTNPIAGEQLPDLQYQSLDLAKDKLNEGTQHYLTYYERNPDVTQVNPTFGELDIEQWEKFHFKHCFHHLSQFGLISQK